MTSTNEKRRVTWWQILLVWLGIAVLVQAFILFQNHSWHSQEHLQQDYEEVVATPIEKITVLEYWNSSAGHGTRFSITFSSPIAIEIKDEQLYEKVALKGSNHGSARIVSNPSYVTCLYREDQKRGDVWVYLNKARTLCSVIAETRLKVALTRNGKRLHLGRQTQLTQMDAGWARPDEKARSVLKDSHKEIEIIFEGITVSTNSIDPLSDSYQTPAAFEGKLLEWLNELEAFNGKNEAQRQLIKDKLLEIEIPDGSLSDEQVAIFERLERTIQLYNAKRSAGQAPVRLKVIVWVTDLISMAKSE